MCKSTFAILRNQNLLVVWLHKMIFYPLRNRWPENISSYEKFKMLSVTGGIPKYLEEIFPHKSVEDNINRLCFVKGGFLVDEFEKIFSNIFIRKTAYYKQIVTALISDSKSAKEICDVLGMDRQGRIMEYLNELNVAGFIAKDHTWNIKNGKDGAIKKFRLSDNYLRFYLKYIEPNLGKIERDAFAVKSISALPQWPSIMGLQFENLVLNNRTSLQKLMRIRPENVVCENPYLQRKTAKYSGCQIDYMVQTKFNTLYVCEIKFSKNPIGVEVIQEVRQKIDRLKRPKGFSCRPVLIHVNGVTGDLIDSDYFAEIIDFGQLLSEPS